MKKRGACDCPIDRQVNNTVKAQKRMKDIVKIVHLPSVVQRNVMKLREYFLYAKETKIMILFNNLSLWRVSAGRKLRTLFCVSRTTRICCFLSNQSVNKRRRLICVAQLTEQCTQFASSGYSPKWRYGDKEETRRRRIVE